MRVLVPFILTLITACSTSQGPDKPATSQDSHVVALVNATVIPMDRERLLCEHTVVVRDGRIVAVGPVSRVRVPAGAKMIHASGKFLMPGLADMHTHLIRREDLLLYLARGVTTVRNMWGAPIHLEWRQRIARGELLGPTLFTAGPIVDGDPPDHDGSLVVRTPEEAERAVLLHKEAGYDFIKVYRGLQPSVFNRLTVTARAAGLKIVGHVPRAVGLVPTMEAGQVSIEHLDGMLEALQRDDSPVRGRWDWSSRRKKIDHVDDGKLPALIEKVRLHGVWNCPTRTVRDSFASLEETRQRLAQLDTRYVPPCERAIWEPGTEEKPEVVESFKRVNALYDRLMVALHASGARMLVGTDPANPLVVPGFSVHQELQHWVRVGIPPYQVLHAATRGAAEFLEVESDVGTIAVGQRADLLLLDGNPLVDIAQTTRIAGVMARGRWFAAEDLATLLKHVAETLETQKTMLTEQPALKGEGTPEYAATYRIIWKNVPFGVERIRVERAADALLHVRAQSHDPHRGQTFTAHVLANGQALHLVSDGARGRGHVDLMRDSTQTRMRGYLLPGLPFEQERDLPQSALLGVEGMLIGKVLLSSKLMALAVGQSVIVTSGEVALGSAAEIIKTTLNITRSPDGVSPRGTQRRFEIKSDPGPTSLLTLDEQGWPVSWEVPAFGDVVRYLRVDG